MGKAKELWDTIVRLETEKYDLEERQKRQDYDLKELKERQKQQLRQKAMKKGLDPEALTGKYPPKIRMYSKYERRTDTRTYEDRRKLYGLSISKLCGRRSIQNGQRGQRPNCPSGSENAQARNPENQNLPMMMKKEVRHQQLK